MPDRSITLTTIARLTGVTAITVSRALRNEAGVSEETRRRILQTAEELGYKPDFFASALAQKKRDNGTGAIRSAIACLVGHRDMDPRHRHTHYQLVFRGMREKCAEMGFSFEVFWAFEPGLSSSRLHRIFQARHIEGCALMSLSPDELDFPWEKYCLVQAAANTMKASVDYSAVDYYNATLLALERMNRQGRAEVALLLPDDLNANIRQRIAGAFRTIKSTPGRTTDATLCWEHAASDPGLPEGKTASLHLLRKDEGRCGVFIPYRELGSIAIELLVTKLFHHQYGLRPDYRGVVIEGTWENGKAV